MDEGWIKLHRKILDWKWFYDGNTHIMFEYLLLTAETRKRTVRGVELEAGMFMINIPQLAINLQLSENSARRALNNLLSTGEVECVSELSNARYRVFRITNWSKYQITKKDTEKTDCPANFEPQNLKPNGDNPANFEPQNLNLKNCTSKFEPQPAPQNLHPTLYPTIKEEKNIYISSEENHTLSDVPSAHTHTHTREDVPIEWKNLANEIYTIYPKKRGNQQMALTAICKAIEDSGDFEHFKEIALNAVKKYADAVSRWDKKDEPFVTTLVKFFENGMYNNDPSTWERNRKGIGSYQGEYRIEGHEVKPEDLKGDDIVF